MAINTSNGKPLFGRVLECVCGTVDVSALRVRFKVKRNLKPEPNTCEIAVYNLDQDNRAALENPNGGKLGVRLEAGYESTGTSQLFLGQARHAWTEWEGADAITTITTGDSEEEMQKARLHLSIGPTMPAEVALTAMVRALGVGQGNVAQAVATLKAKGVAAMFGPGTAISGNVARELTDFCRSAGLEWSIQNGTIQILDRGAALRDLAVELGADTGLVGSPSVDFKGIVKAKAFLIPELVPGRKVSFKSRSVSGGYRIEEVTYTGDTHANDWHADLVCKKY